MKAHLRESLSLCALLLFAGCTEPQLPENHFIVGPEGADVRETASGVHIIIPPGALLEATEITVKGYSSAQSLSLAIGANPFCAGVELGPDGLVFALPVTVTLPVARVLQPDTEYEVWTWIEGQDGGSWRPADATGRTNVDGTAIQFAILHFSRWAGSEFYGRSLAGFDDFVAQAGGDLDSAFHSFMSDFINNHGVQLFDLTRPGPDGSTYKVGGVHFDLLYHYQDTPNPDTPPTESTFTRQFGEAQGAEVTSLSYSYDYQSSSGGTQLVWDLVVTVYWVLWTNDQFPSLFISAGLPWVAPTPSQEYATFYETVIFIPPTIPSTGTFYISSSPFAAEGIWVDDALKFGATYYSLGGNPGSPLGPLGVSPAAGSEVTVQCVDEGASLIGCSQLWLIWIP